MLLNLVECFDFGYLYIKSSCTLEKLSCGFSRTWTTLVLQKY